VLDALRRSKERSIFNKRVAVFLSDLLAFFDERFGRLARFTLERYTEQVPICTSRSICPFVSSTCASRATRSSSSPAGFGELGLAFGELSFGVIKLSQFLHEKIFERV
jgi:hypothetical protein